MKKIVCSIFALSFFLTSMSASAGPITAWSSGTGANGNSYQIVNVSGGITWADAKAAATTAGGYLATITSAEENAFIHTTLGVGTAPLWLGGFQPAGSLEPAGGWGWDNGEAWGYTNWLNGEPNNGGGVENALAFFFNTSGQWNDAPSTYLYNDGGYVIEWSAVPEPSTLILLSIGLMGLCLRRRKLV